MLLLAFFAILPGSDRDAISESLHVRVWGSAHVVDEGIKHVGRVSQGSDVNDWQRVAVLVVVASHQRQGIAQEVPPCRVAITACS